MVMKRSEIKILLVEDDPSVGKALSEGLSRCGFSPRWAKNPEEAVSLFKISEFHAVILDCMLPKKNGVELAKELRKLSGDQFKIIFTSGIFKDKNFTQNAIHQVGATAFLSKPFDFEVLQEVLEGCLGEDLEEEKEPLFELMSREKTSLKEVREALEHSEALHGFDLPWVYSLLHQVGFSGQLHIVPADRELASLVWSKGHIVDVQMKDKESYFGVLLVEMGFTSPEEVEESLASQGGKPIGQLLIDANALSPHAIGIVRTEQLAIRLSKTIQETSVEVRIVEETPAEKGPSITPTQFSIALHDWVSSKISPEWLSSFYLQWMDSPIRITGNLERITRIKDFPLLAAHSDILALIDGRLTLQSLLSSSPEIETSLLKAVHYGVLERAFYFGAKKKTHKDFRSLIQRLNRMTDGMENKNFYEILGLSPKAKAREISRSYLEIAKVFHPDKMDPQAPKELVQLTQRYFSRVTEAYDTLKDEKKRETYQKELESGHAHEALLAESQFEQAKELLSKGQYQKAYDLLKPLNTSKSKYIIGQVRIHICWARLKMSQTRNMTSQQLMDIQDLIAQVPPEDRHCSAFFYVKGLFAKATGDSKKAYTLFRNASAIDPSMSDAKRDMLILAKENQKLASGDWAAKVSNFFKK